jgi:hypothetical protein
VRIPRGAVVTICEHANFQGRCRRLSRSEPDFPAIGFNDKVSAVEAQWDRDGRDWDNRRDWDDRRGWDDRRDWDRRRDDDFRRERDFRQDGRRGEVCFYEHENYQGQRYCAPVGAAVPSVGRSLNDKFSSVQMPPGVSVTVCRDDNFRGPCTSFRGNVGLFRGDWNDTISSFRSQ